MLENNINIINENDLPTFPKVILNDRKTRMENTIVFTYVMALIFLICSRASPRLDSKTDPKTPKSKPYESPH
ncbi:hypothetical protein AB4184_24950, partial [Vibrio splendidus]